MNLKKKDIKKIVKMVYYHLLSQVVVSGVKYLCLMNVNAIQFVFFEYENGIFMKRCIFQKYVSSFIKHSGFFPDGDKIEVSIIMYENDIYKIEEKDKIIYDIHVDENKKKILFMGNEYDFTSIYSKYRDELKLEIWSDYDKNELIHRLDNYTIDCLVDDYYSDHHLDDDGNEINIEEYDYDRIFDQIKEERQKRWDDFFNPESISNINNEIQLKINLYERLLHEYSSKEYQSIYQFLLNKYFTQLLRKFMYIDEHIFKFKTHLSIKKHQFTILHFEPDFQKIKIEFEIFDDDSKLFSVNVIRSKKHYMTFADYDVKIEEYYNESVIPRDMAEEMILFILQSSNEKIFTKNI